MTPVEERIDHEYEELRRLARRVITHDYSPLPTDTEAWNDAVVLARGVQDLLSARREETLLWCSREEALLWWLNEGKVFSDRELPIFIEDVVEVYRAEVLGLPATEPAQPDPQQFVCTHGYRGYCHETKQAAYLCGAEPAQPEEEPKS